MKYLSHKSNYNRICYLILQTLPIFKTDPGLQLIYLHWGRKADDDRRLIVRTPSGK